ncbi:hypothetical protein ACM39_03950 [Chryseobacterium sp. FH2]|uniref:XAC2610-related protein n=1 Tax=Chryseobacterium sp. FH2 TaxID=1674291 RepID=UPI00065AB63D|nr:hypothetical protein [Chryseobacterium sp. FH2]KMQ69259.1 hypothetical protein ACM39_03950 [Chryseobacterium sp. FH2]
MKKLNITSYLWLFFSILISCQKKEDNNIINSNNLKVANYNSYYGKWLPISKENNKFYYCTDIDKFIEIGKNKIYNHTPIEDSNFTIDHIKNKGNQTYLYVDKQESSYYILSWINEEKGIISIKLNDYNTDIFISEKKIKTIDNKPCQPKNKSCAFNDATGRYKFTLETEEYVDDKKQKYPISAWIIIADKKNKKSQEIYFEPNSWATYRDLPCDKFIIKDFNFDGLEDFAIIWDNGGNGGELYEYYFQGKNGIFSFTDSFPLQHGMLAEDINIVNKRITTQSVIGCCHYNLNTYSLKPNGSWEVSSEQRELNKN